MVIYTLLPGIVKMSMAAGIAIVVVILCRSLLKKAPRLFSYLLWSAVLFRLLCPVSVSSSLSMFQLIDVSLAGDGNRENTPAAGRETEKTNLRETQTEETENVLPLSDFGGTLNAEKMQYENENAAGAAREAAMQPENSVRFNIPLFNIRAGITVSAAAVMAASWVWLAGAAGLLLYSGNSLRRLKKQLVGAVCVRDHIYQSDYIASPFVIGILRPKIYLPSSLGEREREYILLHEQTHLRRGDHIIKLLAFAALTIHWFNPLVWLAFYLSARDMEMSCDEAVLRKMNRDIRAEYSASLLSLASGRHIIPGTPLAFGEGDVGSRIKNVMYYKKTAVFGRVLAGILVLGVICVLGSNPKRKEAEKHPGEETNQEEESNLGEEAEKHPGEEKNQKGEMEKLLEEEMQPFGYWGYTGYMDECTRWSGYKGFADADYDNDGKTDRVYRTYIKDTDSCRYRIEFGNGDLLELDKETWDGGAPTILSADLTGNGCNEIVFLQSYGFSTNPSAEGDFAVFEKTSGGYVQAVLPFSESQIGYTQLLTFVYEQDGEQSIRVSCAEVFCEGSVPVPYMLWEEYRYRENYTHAINQHNIWRVSVIKDGETEKLFCEINLFDKWSLCGAELVLGYCAGEFIIEDMRMRVYE